MTRVMDGITQHLEQAATWLSTDDIIGLTGWSRASVGRALRRLWYYNKVTKEKMKGDRFGRMQWATPAHAKDPLFLYAQPLTIFVSAGKRKKSSRIPLLSIVSTNNSQGDLTMQIEQGVETVVAELVAANKGFSAHDVTKELRERVNKDTIQVDPGLAGTVFVQSLGKAVTKIEHPIVRDAVHVLMTSGKYDYDRTHNGDFYEYSPKVVDPTSTGSTPGSTPVSGAPYDGSSTL